MRLKALQIVTVIGWAIVVNSVMQVVYGSLTSLGDNLEVGEDPAASAKVRRIFTNVARRRKPLPVPVMDTSRFLGEDLRTLHSS